MSEQDKRKKLDYAALAAGLDDMREALSAMVTALVKDGFTDREARAIIAGIMAGNLGSED